MSFRKRFTSAAGLCLAALCAVPAAADPAVVILQSLTGSTAFMGVGTASGLKMAFDEANAAGEFGSGKALRVIVEDDANDRAQALSLISRHGRDPEVKAILGPTSGAVAIAGGRLGNEIAVPVVTLTNNMEIPKSGPWAFISTQPPREMMYYAARFAAQKRNVRHCATVSIKEIEVYVALRAAYEEWMREFGVTIVAAEAISNNDIDFSTLATKLAGMDIDCIFIASFAAQGGNIVRQLREAGLDPRVEIFGMNTFASPEFVQTGGPAVEGVYLMSDWVPGGFNDQSRAFAAKYEAAEGHAPDNWAALGYSMGRVVIAALKQVGVDAPRETFRDALSHTAGVPVVIGSGQYSFVDDRAPRSGSHVMQMRDGKAVLVEESPLR